jgi:2-methylcitrate dehydratase PrpD
VTSSQILRHAVMFNLGLITYSLIRRIESGLSRTVAEALGDFALGLTSESIPKEVVECVKLHVMNIIGFCIASSRLEAGKIAADIVKQLHGKEATVIACGYLAPASNAALAKGTMAHVLDFDDTHNEAFVHAGPPVLPAAFAIGEKKIDGKVSPHHSSFCWYGNSNTHWDSSAWSAY